LPDVRAAESPGPRGAVPPRPCAGTKDAIQTSKWMPKTLAATARPMRFQDLSATAPPNDANCPKRTMTRTRTRRCPNPAGCPPAPGRAPALRAMNGREFRPA
jgi:hypothetical protein